MLYYLVEKHVKHSLFIWIFFGWPVTHLMSQLIVLLVFNTLIPLMILCSVHLTSQCDVIMHVIIAIRPDTFYSSFLIPYSIYIKQEMGLKKIPVDYMCGGIEHCKNIWVTSTIFWSSQLHACCVCDTLQTSRKATNLILNQSVVEKLLPLLN